MPLVYPLVWYVYHVAAETPFPVHDADAGVVVIFGAAPTLLLARTVRVMVEKSPPSCSLIELRFARSAGGAAGKFPVPVVTEPVDISSAPEIGYGSHRTILQPFKDLFQLVHGFHAA